MTFCIIKTFLLLGVISLVTCQTCTKPEVSATSYTTQDATVLTSLAFITEFTLKCGNGVKGLPLHAEVDGKTLPAVRLNDENRYQVSWLDDAAKASSGDYRIALYDDEGYVALRKAMRNGEDTSSVKPLVTIIVNFPGAYKGPWVNSEFIAAILAISVWYMAFSAKSKLLA
ncbi:hypothetical protein RUM43_007230 [Polyplax serrata]|uniref:Translocon-associated protein subunit delta n=1 Tax=Polyplax serrata TaxID=468196 RepID=A0AAN8P898_POLSC